MLRTLSTKRVSFKLGNLRALNFFFYFYRPSLFQQKTVFDTSSSMEPSDSTIKGKNSILDRTGTKISDNILLDSPTNLTTNTLKQEDKCNVLTKSHPSFNKTIRKSYSEGVLSIIFTFFSHSYHFSLNLQLKLPKNYQDFMTRQKSSLLKPLNNQSNGIEPFQ